MHKSIYLTTKITWGHIFGRQRHCFAFAPSLDAYHWVVAMKFVFNLRMLLAGRHAEVIKDPLDASGIPR